VIDGERRTISQDARSGVLQHERSGTSQAEERAHLDASNPRQLIALKRMRGALTLVRLTCPSGERKQKDALGKRLFVGVTRLITTRQQNPQGKYSDLAVTLCALMRCTSAYRLELFRAAVKSSE